MLGFPKGGFSMESAATADAYNTNVSEFKNNLVHALLDPYKVDATAAAIITAAAVKTKAESEGCITYTNAGDLMLTAPFNFDAPNYLPAVGSPALTGSSFTGLDAFFTTVPYRGAFGTTNWLTGWGSFTPQTNVY